MQLQHLRSVRRRKSTGQNGENGWTCAARCHFHDDMAMADMLANTSGMTVRALTVWSRTTHPTMPNLAIEPTDMGNLIAYILSLRDR